MELRNRCSHRALCGAERTWTLALRCLPALCLAFAAAPANAQPSAPGSISGKLTDLYSRPIGGATLVLRNSSSGAQTTVITAKNGSYRVTGLPPGEYTLNAASSQLGESNVAGILVSAGHESRVQVSVEFRPPAQVLTSRNPASATPPLPTIPQPVRPILPLSPPQAPSPSPSSPTLETRIPRQPVLNLPLTRTSSVPLVAPSTPPPVHPDSTPIPAPDRTLARSTPPVPAGTSPALSTITTGLSSPGTADPAIASAIQAAHKPPSSSSPILDPQPLDSLTPPLTDRQIQSLPLAGRHWEAFILDSLPARIESDAEEKAPPATTSDPAAIAVDSANIRLAFGSGAGGLMRGSSLMGPAANEAAILEVRTYDKRAEPADASRGDRATLETRSGADHLHGQGFLFDRRNLWGARNPFTQWVKESAPGTSGTIPVFSSFPYTAPDREDRWGLGIGGHIVPRKLFWFAAWDGSARNDPGIATVRHPDKFFAQPRNDEMQVLSARLGLSSVNPIAEGLSAYSGLMENLAGLLGPSARTANQWVGFGRLDWQAAERHRFTVEASGSRWNSPGGGLTRGSEPYGNHSFGSSRASELWILARWEAFVTPNLLAVIQGSAGRHILTDVPNTPSPFEQTLNASVWGQLPQMVVDSRYGFTIGNPARFGKGSYPDERLYELQPAVDWIRGSLLLKAGADWRHNADATNVVRNHTGTFHYSTVENFASDALVFAKYGLSGALDPRRQHNCDPRAKAWRDSANVLHGLGYLPCYSYYSQTMGPTDWHLSTNDLAAYVTAQWQPAKRFVLSAALRWDREYFPPPIALVDNPALPLTQKIPSPGNEWGPRFSMAWGTSKSHWPVLRAGYGMYFARTQNSVLETALTQTGSFKGDLNFFMRPTDNLTGGGAPPFPYVLAGEPSTVVKPGAVEFAPTFRNPEIHQAELSIQENLPGRVQLAATAAVSLGRRLPVSMDTNFDPATNPGAITYAVVDPINAGPIKTRQITVPFFASWIAADSPTGTAGRLNPAYQQVAELMSRANSTYEAASLHISRFTSRGLGFRTRYTYGHARDWNPNETASISGSSMLDPLNFRQEYGTGNLDIRHSLSTMLIWEAPWKSKGFAGPFANGWMLSGIGQFHSGLPYTMRTAGSLPEEFTASGAAIVGLGPGMNGYGGDNRVYGVGRNTYRYPYTWKADMRLGKKFDLRQMRELEVLAETFNLFNHQNVTQLETVGYYISPGTAAGSLPTLNFLTGLKTGQTEFGKPLDVNATDFFRPREFDFGLRLRF